MSLSKKQKNSNEGLVAAIEPVHAAQFLCQIALHIVSYMTVLHLLNAGPAVSAMSASPLRQIPLSKAFAGPHRPRAVY